MMMPISPAAFYITSVTLILIACFRSNKVWFLLSIMWIGFLILFDTSNTNIELNIIELQNLSAVCNDVKLILNI